MAGVHGGTVPKAGVGGSSSVTWDTIAIVVPGALD